MGACLKFQPSLLNSWNKTLDAIPPVATFFLLIANKQCRLKQIIHFLQKSLVGDWMEVGFNCHKRQREVDRHKKCQLFKAWGWLFFTLQLLNLISAPAQGESENFVEVSLLKMKNEMVLQGHTTGPTYKYMVNFTSCHSTWDCIWRLLVFTTSQPCVTFMFLHEDAACRRFCLSYFPSAVPMQNTWFLSKWKPPNETTLEQTNTFVIPFECDNLLSRAREHLCLFTFSVQSPYVLGTK